jgi:hypothetical protein
MAVGPSALKHPMGLLLSFSQPGCRTHAARGGSWFQLSAKRPGPHSAVKRCRSECQPFKENFKGLTGLSLAIGNPTLMKHNSMLLGKLPAILAALLLFTATMAATPSFPVQTYVEAPGSAGPLKGTMLSPASAGTPMLLIIPGSGPTDRDGNNALGVRASTSDCWRRVSRHVVSAQFASTSEACLPAAPRWPTPMQLPSMITWPTSALGHRSFASRRGQADGRTLRLGART